MQCPRSMYLNFSILISRDGSKISNYFNKEKCEIRGAWWLNAEHLTNIIIIIIKRRISTHLSLHLNQTSSTQRYSNRANEPNRYVVTEKKKKLNKTKRKKIIENCLCSCSMFHGQSSSYRFEYIIVRNGLHRATQNGREEKKTHLFQKKVLEQRTQHKEV